MKKVVLCVVAMSVMLAGALPAIAGDGAQQTVQTHLKRVALFKNGFGFFVREGTLTEGQRAVLLGPFAAPAHGTFWISTPSRAGLVGLVARDVAGTDETPAATIQDLLRGSVGRTVSLYLHGQQEPSLTGKLIAFAPESERPQYDPYGMGISRLAGPPPGLGEYALIETDRGVTAFQPSTVSRADFVGGVPSVTYPRPSKQAQLEAVFGSPSPGDWLSVSYLAKGITWAPSYLIDITDPKQARITAKALILNEAEPLDDTHVDLVTGFPHLSFADVLSPISRREGLGQFLQSLARGSSRPEEASVMTQAVMSNSAEGMDFARGVVTPSYGRAAAGQAAEDLFFYPIENVTLGKGETGYYPLFTESVPYAEFYEWQIADYIDPEGHYTRPTARSGSDREVVWHSVRFTNTMAMPWTTAPAQLMKDGQIIGQDTVSYTAPSAASAVKITHAIGVKAEQTEFEVGREREALRLYGDYFDRVTIEGSLRVANYTGELISLEITKTVSGEIKGTQPKAKDVALARGLSAMNAMHELTWKIELQPGDSKEMTYTYQALIRR